MSILTGSANAVRYILFAFNSIFFLTGIILIGVGVGVTAIFAEYNLFLVHNFFSIPTFIVVIGSFVIVISFFGCWGALKENYCLIFTFSVLLGIIFVLELSAGISGYVLRDDAEQLINGTMTDTLLEYKPYSDDGITVMWDTLQENFQCCGVSSYEDWTAACPTWDGGLPLSCCQIPHGTVGTFECNNSTDTIYRNSIGCLTTFSTYIEVHAVSLGAAGVVIGIIQFFGVIFACYIAREIKIRNGISGFM